MPCLERRITDVVTFKQKSVEELILQEIADGRGIENILFRFRNSVIIGALNQANGNVTHASELLKCHRNNLHRWMREADMTEEWRKKNYEQV